jgi:hypothetical protein
MTLIPPKDEAEARERLEVAVSAGYWPLAALMSLRLADFVGCRSVEGALVLATEAQVYATLAVAKARV